MWLFHEVSLDFWNELVYREAISQYKRDTCDLLELLEWTDSIFAKHLSLEDTKAAQLLATIVIGGVGPIVVKNGIWEQVSCAHALPPASLASPCCPWPTQCSVLASPCYPSLADLG